MGERRRSKLVLNEDMGPARVVSHYESHPEYSY